MTQITLYKYTIEDKVVVSPHKPADGIEYTNKYRLVADEGKALTLDFQEYFLVIDVDENVEEMENNPWHEVEYTFPEDPEEEPEEPTPVEPDEPKKEEELPSEE